MWPNFLSRMGDAFDAFPTGLAAAPHALPVAAPGALPVPASAADPRPLPVIRIVLMDSELLPGHIAFQDAEDPGIVRDYGPAEIEMAMVPVVQLDEGLGGGTDHGLFGWG